MGTFEAADLLCILEVDALVDDACSGPAVAKVDGDMDHDHNHSRLVLPHSNDHIHLHQTQSSHTLCPHRKMGHALLGSPCDCIHAAHNSYDLLGCDAQSNHCRVQYYPSKVQGYAPAPRVQSLMYLVEY